MKKIIIASLGLSLLGGAAMFGQNSTMGTKTEKKMKHKKGKKGTTMSSTTSTTTTK